MNLNPALAADFARIALDNIAREYPNKPDHLLQADTDLRPPRELHPAFYGSYDWHSSVHMHWLLARLLRLHPGLVEAKAIIAAFDTRLTTANGAAEARYLADGARSSFERPYGWSWLLKLQAELLALGPTYRRWSIALQPLADLVEARYLAYLPRLQFPIRTGTHGNTAFGLLFPLDYARAAQRHQLERAICHAALTWFGNDRRYPAAYEPGGEDFLSAGLMEAALMARLPRFPFAAWWSDFRPAPPGEQQWLEPVTVEDRDDPRLVHLDGLNLSRAWCWKLLASALAGEQRAQAGQAAHQHLQASLAQAGSGNYVATHWLASFALLALTEG